ncbi:MAG TPA: hypothetical protein VF772_02875, partial [Terriglobales bacterium]
KTTFWPDAVALNLAVILVAGTPMDHLSLFEDPAGPHAFWAKSLPWVTVVTGNSTNLFFDHFLCL